MIGHEETQLGQELGALAENGELELPNATAYTSKDYATAVHVYLTTMRNRAINALTNGEPETLREMAKYLTRYCDMPKCYSPALPGDIFCRHHRTVEDSLIGEYEDTNNLPF
jgi:hypothetical protein